MNNEKKTVSRDRTKGEQTDFVISWFPWFQVISLISSDFKLISRFEISLFPLGFTPLKTIVDRDRHPLIEQSKSTLKCLIKTSKSSFLIGLNKQNKFAKFMFVSTSCSKHTHWNFLIIKYLHKKASIWNILLL